MQEAVNMNKSDESQNAIFHKNNQKQSIRKF